MSASPPPLRTEDFETFRLIHLAMSREVDAIARMIGALAPQDRVRPQRLRQWMRFVEKTFAHHHRVEDRWFFPTLIERDPTFAAAHEALEVEHATIDPLLRNTCDGLVALSVAPDAEWASVHQKLLRDAQALRDHLTLHLKHEEDQVIDRSVAHLRRVDMETFNRRALGAMPVQDMRMVLPWLLQSCTDAERERAVEHLPFATRWLYRLLWRPRFDAITQPLRA